MENILSIILISFLCSLNWIFVWQSTTLKVHFLECWLFLRRSDKEVYTPMDFDEHVTDNWGLLGELLTCQICLSHWTSAIFTLICCAYTDSNYFLIPISFFSYPFWIYILNKKVL